MSQTVSGLTLQLLLLQGRLGIQEINSGRVGTTAAPSCGCLHSIAQMTAVAQPCIFPLTSMLLLSTHLLCAGVSGWTSQHHKQHAPG